MNKKVETTTAPSSFLVMKQAQSEHDFSELIEIFPTGFGPTEAQNFFVFDWEFIVIGNFLAISDGLLRINGDFLLPIDSNNFSITIGLKRINKFKLKVPRQDRDLDYRLQRSYGLL